MKRARVLQRKLLYATAAVPKRETGPSTEQGWGPLKKKHINVKYVRKHRINQSLIRMEKMCVVQFILTPF